MEQRCEKILWIAAYGKEQGDFAAYLDPNNEASEYMYPYTHIMMRVDSTTNQLVPLSREAARNYRYSHNYSIKNSDFLICFEASIAPLERILCEELVKERDDVYGQPGVYIPCDLSRMSFDDCRNKIMESLGKQPEINKVKEKSKLQFFANTNNESPLSSQPADVMPIEESNSSNPCGCVII